VNVIEAANVNVHAILVKLASGQLPFRVQEFGVPEQVAQTRPI
jgi:hypothetical protein